MTTTPEHPSVEEAIGFCAELDELEQRLAEWHAPSDPVTQSFVEALATAYEELRVADEEVRSQHRQVTSLLERERVLLSQQERMMAPLPVAIVGTDPSGTIRSGNSAAAALLEVGPARMVGKPLFSFVAMEDRAPARRLLHAAPGMEAREVVTLVSRSGRTMRVQMCAWSLVGPTSPVWWLLLPAHLAAGSTASDLPAALSRLAMLPASAADARDALAAAAPACQQALGPATSVSLVMGSPLSPSQLATSSQTAQNADGAQMLAGEGPSLDAFTGGTTVDTPDLQHDTRWHSMATRLTKAVTRAVAVPLVVGEETIGVITAYDMAEVGSPLQREDVELLAVTVAGVLLELRLRRELEELAEDLQRAMQSRATIEQAKGIIMALRRVGADEAFAHLVRLSSSRHRKLRDVAREIVESIAAHGPREPGPVGVDGRGGRGRGR